MKNKTFYYIIAWIILLIISNKFKLAFLYLIGTGLYLIFTNLGTRKEGEISAYSVFNKNCEKILGTFDSNQIEREVANRNNENLGGGLNERDKMKNDIARDLK